MKHLSILVPDEQTTMSTTAWIIGSFQVFAEANKFKERSNEKPIFKIDLVGATEDKFLQNGFLSIKQNTTLKEVAETTLIIIPASLVCSYKTATINNKLLMD